MQLLIKMMQIDALVDGFTTLPKKKINNIKYYNTKYIYA